MHPKTEPMSQITLLAIVIIFERSNIAWFIKKLFKI